MLKHLIHLQLIKVNALFNLPTKSSNSLTDIPVLPFFLSNSYIAYTTEAFTTLCHYDSLNLDRNSLIFLEPSRWESSVFILNLNYVSL